MKITLIRHTSVNVATGICYGQSDVDPGINFSIEAKNIKTKIQHNNFDAVYCSPLSRCTILANYCGFMKPIIDDRLMEMNFGDWEMKAWDDINDPHLQAWYANWVNEKATNGESFTELIGRVQDVVHELSRMNFTNIAIFTHAGVIRSILIIYKFISIQNSFRFMVNYADVIEIDTHKVEISVK